MTHGFLVSGQMLIVGKDKCFIGLEITYIGYSMGKTPHTLFVNTIPYKGLAASSKVERIASNFHMS